MSTGNIARKMTAELRLLADARLSAVSSRSSERAQPGRRVRRRACLRLGRDPGGRQRRHRVRRHPSCAARTDRPRRPRRGAGSPGKRRSPRHSPTPRTSCTVPAIGRSSAWRRCGPGSFPIKPPQRGDHRGWRHWGCLYGQRRSGLCPARILGTGCGSGTRRWGHARPRRLYGRIRADGAREPATVEVHGSLSLVGCRRAEAGLLLG